MYAVLVCTQHFTKRQVYAQEFTVGVERPFENRLKYFRSQMLHWNNLI